MVHFNIPSLWKAGVLFNLCLHQGSHVPHFTSAHTRTHTHRPSCRAPQPLLLNFRYGNYRNVTVLMCWMTKSNALLHTQLWKLFRREPSTTAMGYGFLSFINKKPCLFTLKTSFSSLFFFWGWAQSCCHPVVASFSLLSGPTSTKQTKKKKKTASVSLCAVWILFSRSGGTAKASVAVGSSHQPALCRLT